MRKAPTRMPESFRMATLFPDAAIRPNRPADPFSCDDMEENVSDYIMRKLSVSLMPKRLIDVKR